jgi:spermidine/putrescine transport system permease protein
MATPEVIMGASLLSLWVTMGAQRGLSTIIIAHIMFNISYVVVTVRARIAGFNRSLEEAAMDLGADEWTTFRKVTLPLIFPGILAAALLAFALSIDDYVITSFVSGQTTTFPLWVYGASRFGVPPEVNVLGTLIFVIAGLAILAQILWARRSAALDRAAMEVKS